MAGVQFLNWLTARLNGQVRDEAGNLSEVAK